MSQTSLVESVVAATKPRRRPPLTPNPQGAVPFSEKLRSGGSLPNGAVAPERNFLFISSADVRLYAQIAKEHLLGVRH